MVSSRSALLNPREINRVLISRGCGGLNTTLLTHCSLGGVQDYHFKRKRYKVLCLTYFGSSLPCVGSLVVQGPFSSDGYHRGIRRLPPVLSSVLDDGTEPSDSDDENPEKVPPQMESGGINNEFLENLEKVIGTDDSTFSGIDLAMLIRNKYGRSYDVQLIKKEFMGRNLLAMNVMWKYREQKSFPLTEEEYLLRLDDVANTLKCWGAVSHIRNSLAKLKERPRIGKAVSIFIDMDETGGRAREWIYK
ncbi:hypothetical protein Sjap_014562 [Stephania japonica]|uniref:Uncharacterized protein n=1 Tax=Stephania japonica TaxID=461633 RepID=A0AAP0NS09_9MAGN